MLPQNPAGAFRLRPVDRSAHSHWERVSICERMAERPERDVPYLRRNGDVRLSLREKQVCDAVSEYPLFHAFPSAEPASVSRRPHAEQRSVLSYNMFEG